MVGSGYLPINPWGCFVVHSCTYDTVRSVCIYTYDNRQGSNYLTFRNYLFFKRQTLKRNFSGERPIFGISGFSVNRLCSPLWFIYWHQPASLTGLSQVRPATSLETMFVLSICHIFPCRCLSTEVPSGACFTFMTLPRLGPLGALPSSALLT